MESYGTILLVEDDISLALWIKEYLTDQGYHTIDINRGDLAVNMVKQHKPDLVLLDLMLPGMDGIQVCRSLREFYHEPILMLTAKSDELDEVIGLEVGANDYIIKPVRPRALLARIKSALQNKRSVESEKETCLLNFGQLSIDANAKRVELNQQEINLTTTEFELLWLMANHAGEVLDRDTVFKVIKGWEYNGMDRRIDVVVSSIRRKLGDTNGKPKRIKTVWGKGYLFVADAWEES